MSSVWFDPFGWLTRWIPEGILHGCVRAAVVVVLPFGLLTSPPHPWWLPARRP